MTSEANRSYFVNNIRIWSGIDTKTVVYNDETNDTATPEEEIAFAEIEKVLGIDMPSFYYRPYGLELVNYEVDEKVSIARLEYLYEEKFIILLIDQQSGDRASNINSAHGEETETVITVGDGIKVTIEKIQDIQDKEPSYTAQWERDDVFYYLSGKIELGELRQMIENMVY